jgi:hypothetical protein
VDRNLSQEIRQAASDEIRRRYEMLFPEAGEASIKDMGIALELYGYVAGSAIKEYFRTYSGSGHENLESYWEYIPYIYNALKEIIVFPISEISDRDPAGKLMELYRENTWPIPSVSSVPGDSSRHRSYLSKITSHLVCDEEALLDDYYDEQRTCVPGVDSPEILKEVHESPDMRQRNIRHMIRNSHRKITGRSVTTASVISSWILPTGLNKLVKLWNDYAVAFSGQPKLVLMEPLQVQAQDRPQSWSYREPYQQYHQYQQEQQREQLTEQEYQRQQLRQAPVRARIQARIQARRQARRQAPVRSRIQARRQAALEQDIARDRARAQAINPTRQRLTEVHIIEPQDSEFIQYEQTEEKYVERKNKPLVIKTNGLVPSQYSDCKFKELASEDTVLLSILEQADHICETEKVLAKNDDLRKEFINPLSYPAGTMMISLQSGKLSASGEIDNKDLFFMLLSLPITDNRYQFTGTVALDFGGVARQVFTKAGKYIQDNFLTQRGNRYYFTSLKKGSGKAVAHVLRLALTQGMVLSIPLSYGILYCMREGMIPDLDNMSLEQLIYLYWKDQDKCAESLSSILSPYYWNPVDPENAEEIQDSSRIMGVLLKKELSPDDRLEWIRRYLFGYLFGTTRDGRLVRNKELESFLAPLPGIWSEKLQPLIKIAALDNIADITGPSVDSDSVYSLIRWNEANPIIEGHMKRYLAESTENLRKFLIFVTGAVDLTQPIKVGIFITRDKLPISHTCTKMLEINRDYPAGNYESFKRDFDWAINEEEFGFH